MSPQNEKYFAVLDAKTLKEESHTEQPFGLFHSKTQHGRCGSLARLSSDVERLIQI